MTLEKDTCQYKYIFIPKKKCQHPPLEEDKDNYCLLHSRDDDKDKEAFSNEIQKKLENNAFDFWGYYFPLGLKVDFRGKNFNNANFSNAIFRNGVDFTAAKFIGKTGTSFITT